MSKTQFKRKLKLPEFLRPIFWSYNFYLLDPQRNKHRIIIDTINYGNWEHWQWLIKNYGRKEVKKIIRKTPETEFRTQVLKLICLLLGIKNLKYASRSAYIASKKNI